MKIIKNEVLSALLELQNRIAKLIIAYKQVSSSTNLVRQIAMLQITLFTVKKIIFQSSTMMSFLLAVSC